VRPSEITALHTGPAGEFVEPIPESRSDGPVTIGGCGDSTAGASRLGAALTSALVLLWRDESKANGLRRGTGGCGADRSFKCNCSVYGVAGLSGGGATARSAWSGNTCNSATGGETTDASSQPVVSAAAAINVTCLGRMEPSPF